MLLTETQLRNIIRYLLVENEEHYEKLGKLMHSPLRDPEGWMQGFLLGVDAGYIREGDRADVVVINPQGLTDEVDDIHEAPMEGFGIDRLVKRNDDAVDLTIINGQVAYEKGDCFPENLGKEKGYGQFLINRYVEERAIDQNEIPVSV